MRNLKRSLLQEILKTVLGRNGLNVLPTTVQVGSVAKGNFLQELLLLKMILSVTKYDPSSFTNQAVNKDIIDQEAFYKTVVQKSGKFKRFLC